jgi:hypothetical protein
MQISLKQIFSPLERRSFRSSVRRMEALFGILRRRYLLDRHCVSVPLIYWTASGASQPHSLREAKSHSDVFI